MCTAIRTSPHSSTVLFGRHWTGWSACGRSGAAGQTDRWLGCDSTVGELFGDAPTGGGCGRRTADWCGTVTRTASDGPGCRHPTSNWAAAGIAVGAGASGLPGLSVKDTSGGSDGAHPASVFRHDTAPTRPSSIPQRPSAIARSRAVEIHPIAAGMLGDSPQPIDPALRRHRRSVKHSRDAVRQRPPTTPTRTSSRDSRCSSRASRRDYCSRALGRSSACRSSLGTGGRACRQGGWWQVSGSGGFGIQSCRHSARCIGKRPGFLGIKVSV